MHQFPRPKLSKRGYRWEAEQSRAFKGGGKLECKLERQLPANGAGGSCLGASGHGTSASPGEGYVPAHDGSMIMWDLGVFGGGLIFFSCF